MEHKTSCQYQFISVATVNANISSYSDENLNPATLYYYQVKAYNNVGDSDYSNMAQAITWADIPTIEKLIGLLNSYQDQFKNDGIYNSLLVKLQAIQTSINTKDYQSALGQLGAFVNEAEAQTDKAFNSDIGNSLITLATELIDYFKLISSLPVILDLYLTEEPCTNDINIQLLNGGVAQTTLNGNLKVQLSPTENPDIVSIRILESQYNTALMVNETDFGILQIINDTNKLSEGILNINTGQFNLTYNASVSSPLLDVLGISPVAIETAETGTFYPMSLNNGKIRTIGKGIIPPDVPEVGNRPFIAQGEAKVPPAQPKPEKPKVIEKWTQNIPEANLKVERNDKVITETFTTPAKTTKLILPLKQREFIPGYGYISFFQAETTKGVQIEWEPTSEDPGGVLYYYGKSVVIDMVPTTEQGKKLDIIQVVSHTILTQLPGQEPKIHRPGKWDLNGIADPKTDPTYEFVYPNGIGTGVFMWDTPGYGDKVQPWESPFLERDEDGNPIIGQNVIHLYEYNTWLIDTETFKVIGYWKWKFTVTLTIGEGKVDVKVTEQVLPNWTLTPSGPDSNTEEGKRYIDVLKEQGCPPQYYEKYEKKGKK